MSIGSATPNLNARQSARRDDRRSIRYDNLMTTFAPPVAPAGVTIALNSGDL